jgi:hypothetical protein
VTIIEVTPVGLFAIQVAALVHVGLALLAISEARKSWAAAPKGERAMWVAGLFAMVGLPVILALRIMG